MAIDRSPTRFSRPSGPVLVVILVLAATVFGSIVPGLAPSASGASPEPKSASSSSASGGGPSVVTVYARGRLGTEDMELRINDRVVSNWRDVARSEQAYSYAVEGSTVVERLQVALSSDGSDGGWPASLIVDKIEVDGNTYQSEQADTHSRGSWTPTTGCSPGYKRGEWLQSAAGWFEYEAAVGLSLTGSAPVVKPPGGSQPPVAVDEPSVIDVRARGRLGTEDMALRVNGRTVMTWHDISSSSARHRYVVDESLTIDSLQVAMIGGGWPQALIVDGIEFDGMVYESESAGTSSSGSWTAATGCSRGNKRSEWLHCNDAHFDYEEARGVELAGGRSDPTPERPSILVMTKTSVFTHPSISDGVALLDGLGRDHGFDLTYSTDSSLFQDRAAVADFDAVLFLNTDGVVFETDAQKAAFREFIEQGKGFIGIHGAAATHWNGDKWDWYRDLVGQRFVDHPTTPNQPATVRVVDRDHPSTALLPDTWQVRDEWYNFEGLPTGVDVLLAVDESTYSGGTMGPWHPIAWTHRYGPGRSPVWYTNLGHEPALYRNPDYVQHVRGGIEWVLGAVG